MTDLVGRVLSGRYRLTAPIGAGASAQVFLAEDTRLKRRVAVKVLHAALADDESFLRRFRAEAQAAAALNHPHIVAVYDWGDDDDGTPYLVTELLSGGSLRGMLDAGHRLTPSQALIVGLEATRALDHAHRRGFVHRDIKPANLLFGDDGRLRIADFGLARALAEAAWTEPAGAMLGTARYASPEQARGEPVDGRADVYALGLVLIEAVTGKVPFAADTTIGTLMARIDTPVEVPAALGPLRKLLARAGQPSPADRPDAGEFGVGLMAAAEELDRPAPLPLVGVVPGGVVTAEAADPTLLPGGDDTGVVVTGARAGAGPWSEPGDGDLSPETVPPPRRRRRWLRALLVAVLVAGLAAGGWVASQTVFVASHEVPELVGLDRAAAEALVEENGWDLVVEEGRDDASVAGQVLAQDPSPGESLKEGEVVVLTISLGRELRTVPTDLAGLPLADAEARLVAAGLTVGEHQRTNDEEVAADHVIGVVEGTPAEAETGTAVSLVVSDGPVPRTVPAIAAGSDPAAACAPIEAQQLVCEQVQEFDDTIPNGQVIGTDPPAGAQVERGATVRVLVSKGPDLVPVPDVTGQTVAEARATLEAAGLLAEVFPSGATGRVIASDPTSGTMVRRGTPVSLFARR